MKKLLKVILIPLFLAITFVFYLPTVKAQFDPDNDFPLLYLGFTATNTDIRNDPTNSNRSILVIKVEFTSPLTTINQLTVTFDDVKDLGIGEPAIYFLSGMVDNTGMSTVSMSTMNINANGGIGDNLFYFNYPYSDTTTYIMVYISIDKTLDTNYINNQQAIFDAIRFVPLAPYQYTKLLEQYTESEIQEMILIARFNGYQEGLKANALEFAEDLQQEIEKVYNDGFLASGYADLYDLDPDLGWDYLQGYTDGVVLTEGEAYTQGYLDGGNDSFMANIDKWLVPAIIIVLIAGGFIAFMKMRKEQ